MCVYGGCHNSYVSIQAYIALYRVWGIERVEECGSFKGLGFKQASLSKWRVSYLELSFCSKLAGNATSMCEEFWGLGRAWKEIEEILDQLENSRVKVGVSLSKLMSG